MTEGDMMIRAGRQELVRTLADLARQRGVKTASYVTARPYAAKGFPAPISSAGSRILLFDADQVDAHLAGEPVPALPVEEHDDDLLDRRECAALFAISPRTWDTYKNAPELTGHMVVIGGVEHWPRGVVRAFAARPKKPAAAGRPKGAGDQVPREQVMERTAPLLDADPTISAAGVTQALGIHRDTAQNALTQLRAQRIADLLDADPSLTPKEAAQRLGYPGAQVRRALALAEVEQRARRIAPYLDTVAQAVRAAGWTTAERAPAVQYLDGEACAAALILESPTAPAPALVWDERYGWRTAPSRRHPFGKDTAHRPAGDGIRHLLQGHTTPDPAVLLAALAE
ncbi:hypothetical protein [Streptomyces sp. NPDC008121]|uniref:hypothetical protein n=1 Tax=Streptomyces sp. NPDC008121 TaxID=3364809 RepID=UPI0036EC374A